MKKGKIQFVDKIDWSKIDFIICGTYSYLDNDKWGYCARCKKKICFRPYQPEDTMKVCEICAVKILKKHEDRASH